MIVSNDEKKIGMTLGRKLIKDAKVIDSIIIYNKDHDGDYKPEIQFKVPFPKACIQFYFDQEYKNFLIFFSKESVFRFNYLQDMEK